ncbi:hypothetical protein BFU36_05680 [Sulfolobus sp. A20]|uniref:hypothetical protein n=1 Tax=Sulfolobaceae TaxID=118883 RepID=UPI000845CAC1|nr:MULTISPECIES: hypothetical protein [unclassified Sulfolobus]TRM77355.1 hypothetical protein DJ532_04780 [Sulfolobus sp. A20-N-F8]TRM79185.1 hypothetical protein DJ528_02270 [Sulfolobus sp. B5]TRM81163.1 hypothetical protein DJ524_05075 [Sulfolobus sp. D5]TRM86568.1 hypothetical protein DJ529_10975 [Sulfolobus sp. C3]TRM86900.1 hypothetical protein DJ521_04615 [Sulfolobus sp. E3]TRM94589.1 hypothetical protein DJ526_02185 [Sulfolobus sp. A20-N-G8]TRN00664.1 hypothetical protein DJ527_06925
MSELDFILKKRKSNNVETQPILGENKESTENKVENFNEKDKIKVEMMKYINKDPKIGVWSYPAFLVLQYLYHTVPGFKMSRVAKEALEKGLKEMYPDLFEVAEKLSSENKQ